MVNNKTKEALHKS